MLTFAILSITVQTGNKVKVIPITVSGFMRMDSSQIVDCQAQKHLFKSPACPNAAILDYSECSTPFRATMPRRTVCPVDRASGKFRLFWLTSVAKRPNLRL
jgi:hypothetical protein